MPNILRHPNKDIQEAIRYAILKGWRVEKAGPRAHIWGRALCPENNRNGHIYNIHSTPRNPTIHARNSDATSMLVDTPGNKYNASL